MNKYKIKRLAEQYHYFDKKLTPEERYILENSKYKSILKKESAFDKQLERYTLNEQEEAPVQTVKKRRRMAMLNISRGTISRLIDDVEDQFNLDILSQNASRYNAVNIEELKQYIKDYADKNIYDNYTKREIEKVLEGDSVHSILHRLYSLE
jgi:hypothetical protein